ncbi:MAG: type II secretion system protein GspD [Deltaproteobacteria bacterium]|nr:type II secretion system protein GspD [Deltaproteobacteria bacterium]
MRPHPLDRRSRIAPGAALLAILGLLVWSALVWSALVLSAVSPAAAQEKSPVAEEEEELVSLDFSDVELPVVVDTISRMTGYNFIYDDRVRGRVTIVSPTQVTIAQAFAVFESVLKVKGFSLVLGPGNTYKIIPIRDVKESSIDTIKDNRPSPNRDRFVTRLVPLRFIDADAITQTIKPLISKDASLVAYAPTNTIIVTDSESNIRRLLSILDAIDVESYRQELAVITIEHADASTLGEQLSEIYGAEVSTAAGGATAAQRRSRARRRTSSAANQAADTGASGTVGPTVRILTDERTNSLLVLASRQQLADIRGLVRKLDIPVTGKGRIRVYYLRHADAEELAETLESLLSGAGSAGGGRSSIPGAASNSPQNLRSVVTPLADGVTVTADKATNSLVIQASKEAYETLEDVLEQLDVSRPRVLVEALIVEVDVTDSLDLGFNAVLRLINGDTDMLFQTGAAVVPGAGMLGQTIRAPAFSNPTDMFDQSKPADQDGTTNLSIGISASEGDSDVNIVSAPHILTSDNEEAEIRIGNNIPIVTGRTEAATGNTDSLSQSVNVERQDVGVTLRVTPQISEGDTLRLQIFQELTEVAESVAGDVDEVGVTLSSRKVENTVVVNDGETVAIGGLISEVFTENESGVPWLMDIPWLGWVFKQKSEDLRKINLLVFLTPHIIRSAEDLEQETIRKRLELEDAVADEGDFPELAEFERKIPRAGFAAAQELAKHAERYPIDRMRFLEQQQADARAERAADVERQAAAGSTRYAVTAASYGDESRATENLTTLIDAGYDGSLVTSESEGQLIFTIQIGPFDDLWEAEQAAQTLDAAYGYASDVTVLRRQQP